MRARDGMRKLRARLMPHTRLPRRIPVHAIPSHPTTIVRRRTVRPCYDGLRPADIGRIARPFAAR